MRSFNEYGLSEWACGTPLVHGFKRARNVLIERSFRRMRVRGFERFVADHMSYSGKTIALTVAFNAPWVIELLARSTRRHLRGAELIVLDNSRDENARIEIERVCGERGVPYIGLPFNPERHPCRSHGIAMTWGYYNLVRTWRPKVFAFLDHDLFPLEPLDLAGLVTTQPLYGVPNRSRWGWNLWAGYCIYDFKAIEQFKPDFNNDNPRKLDTGGRNWIEIYRHLDPIKLRFAEVRHIALIDPADGEPKPVTLVDRSLHARAAGFGEKRTSRLGPEFFERILRRSEEGASIADMLAAPGSVRA